MHIPESHADLLSAAPAVILATVGPDGFPQVTAVGFAQDGERIIMSVTADKHKAKNLWRHPACSLMFVQAGNLSRTLEMRGLAEVIEDPEFVWAAKVAEANGTDGASRSSAPHTISGAPAAKLISCSQRLVGSALSACSGSVADNW